MLARFQCLDGDGRVQIVWQGDGDRVDVWLFEQLPVIGVAAGNLETIGRFLRAGGTAFGDGRYRGAATMQEAVQVVQADAARADDRAAKCCRHVDFAFSGELVAGFITDISHRVNREVISALFSNENAGLRLKNRQFLTDKPPEKTYQSDNQPGAPIKP